MRKRPDWGCRGEGHSGGPGRRYFGRGNVKFALLELLAKEPMHGYQMMKALEERSDGRYTPSAGSIYPTLQMMEDRGWIDPEEEGGKKVYRATAAGLAALEEWNEQSRSERERSDAEPLSSRERRLGDTFELIRLLTKAEKKASFSAGYAAKYESFLNASLQELRTLLTDGRAEEPRDRNQAAHDVTDISDSEDTDRDDTSASQSKPRRGE